MPRGIAPPTYTQTPNEVFALMPQLDKGTMFCLLHIVRETFGYHRRSRKLTITDFMKATGLSRQTVITSLDILMNEHGIVDRSLVCPDRPNQGYEYFFVIKEENPEKEEENTVLSLDHAEKGHGLTIRPCTVLPLDHETPDSSTEIEALKKDVKERRTHPPYTNVGGGVDGWDDELKAKVAAVAGFTRYPSVLGISSDVKRGKVLKNLLWVVAELEKEGVNFADQRLWAFLDKQKPTIARKCGGLFRCDSLRSAEAMRDAILLNVSQYVPENRHRLGERVAGYIPVVAVRA